MQLSDEPVVGMMDLLNAMSQSLLEVVEDEADVDVTDRKFHLRTQGIIL